MISDELLASLDAEHDEMAAALAKARSAMGRSPRPRLDTTPRPPSRPSTTCRRLTVKHLDHEEAELEPVYLSQKDSAEMRAMGKEFAKVSPSRGGRFFAWVTDGASPEEQQAVTGNVPGPVLAVIGGIFGRGYRKNIAPIWRS